MRVENNTNSPNMKALYFVKSQPLFNKSFHYSNSKNVQVSETGVRYFEDKNIDSYTKTKFAQIPFIKNLAEKFDTFVQYVKGIPSNTSHTESMDIAYITWADRTKPQAESKIAFGVDKDKNLATSNLFKNLKNEIFVLNK